MSTNTTIIDRRLNSPGKSHENKQRLTRRVQPALGEAIKDAAIGGKGGHDIHVPRTNSHINEPRLRRDHKTGQHDQIQPGNKKYASGDTIDKPKDGSGSGTEGATQGNGQDDFVYTVSHDDFMQMLFDEHGLPDFIKDAQSSEERKKIVRAGYSRTGNPSNIDLKITAKNALARRKAARRPGFEQFEAAQNEVARLQKSGTDEKLLEASLKLEEITRKRQATPFLDPFDMRYRRFEARAMPAPKAVMFCLLDVSVSMNKHRKDLAKRFFLLMNAFLEARYKQVDIVFIRHTNTAHEVNEHAFFRDQDTGGTIMSTALEKMQQIVKERYPLDNWNIYGVQASDGDNALSDQQAVIKCMTGGPNDILSVCQYFAYLEVGEKPGSFMNPHPTELWKAYKAIAARHSNFVMKKVFDKMEINSVFTELFGIKSRPTQTSALAPSIHALG